MGKKNRSKKNKINKTKIDYIRRNRRLKKNGFNSYQEYLDSDMWKKKRDQKEKEVCLCGSGDRLELHHKTYERVCDELMSDLVWLCHSCHDYLHNKINNGDTTLKDGMKILTKYLKTKKYRKRKEVKKSNGVAKVRYAASFMGLKVRRYKASKKQIEYMEYRTEQALEKHEQNVASQKYREAFKQWLANGDFSIPKPNLADF